MTSTLTKPPAVEVRPVLKEVMPPPKRPRLIRWIEYAAIIVVLVAASAVAIILLRGGDEALPFDVEAGSPAIIGARHHADFAVPGRMVFESDMTLADFEAVFDGFGTLYEAESLAAIGARHVDLVVAPRLVFESDMTLEDYEASR